MSVNAEHGSRSHSTLYASVPPFRGTKYGRTLQQHQLTRVVDYGDDAGASGAVAGTHQRAGVFGESTKCSTSKADDRQSRNSYLCNRRRQEASRMQHAPSSGRMVPIFASVAAA